MFDDTYNDVRKSIDSLNEKFQTSLEADSGVAELSALLSECDTLRDRLDLMSSSWNTIDSQLRTQRRSSLSQSGSLLLLSSSSVQSHTMKTMLQQTKDEYNRLVQTLRSSKQTIESKQQRLHVLSTQIKDLQNDYDLLLNQTKVLAEKDDQYEYKDEVQRRRVNFAPLFRSKPKNKGNCFVFLKFFIQEIEPKQNRLETIATEAAELNENSVSTSAKRVATLFNNLSRDLTVLLFAERKKTKIFISNLFFVQRFNSKKRNDVSNFFKLSTTIVFRFNKIYKRF